VGILLTIIFGGGALIAYVMIERRINQRACSECGFRLSVDATDEQCPRCGSMLRSGGED
jgi:hypothetical protein